MPWWLIEFGLKHYTTPYSAQGHHVGLREKWSHITSELLTAVPPIPGLHSSIIVPSRSLHLTLGVLSLVPENEKSTGSDITGEGASSLSQFTKHSVSDALQLLQSLREPIVARLRDISAPLTVPLEQLDVMNANVARAHVLWSGPDVETSAGARLFGVCGVYPLTSYDVGVPDLLLLELVHAAFREAGMLQDSRTLKVRIAQYVERVWVFTEGHSFIAHW